MKYTLVGSKTSPFVRRIRMLLADVPFEFKELNIFENGDEQKLHDINPIHQVPVLIDGEKTIWDSRIIIQYLNEKHGFEKLDWKKENMLTAIDGALNAGVSLLLSKRSNLDIDGDVMYFKRQHERMNSILDFFKSYLEGPEAKEWNIVNMSIYSYLDWAAFRGIKTFSDRPECLKFIEQHSSRDIVKSTEIPKS